MLFLVISHVQTHGKHEQHLSKVLIIVFVSKSPFHLTKETLNLHKEPQDVPKEPLQPPQQ